MKLVEIRLAEAKRDIQKIEGAVRYITAKGHIRTKEPESWEKLIYKVYVESGIVYTEREGKRISPKPKKTKRISDV